MTAAEGFAPITLLLSDVVDSTKLNVELGDSRMAALWAAHDEAARSAMRRCGGTEIGRSDGFLMMFPSVEAAVEHALAYHAALAALQPPLAARVGIHIGPAQLRENSPQAIAGGALRYEVDGLALPLTARVMPAARGGQTLITGAALDALGPAAKRWRLRTHGYWRFKGIDAPVALHEVDDGHTLLGPPADSDKAWRVVRHDGMWLPRRKIRHSLPAERDPFIGRAAALHALAGALQASRLVSITGPGGIGKTRLAVHFGWHWLGDWSGGVWFCDLASARDEAGIVQGVALGLELRLDEADPIEQIARAIAGRGECLVLLDNFEQVDRFAAATLGRWLDRAPQARFVVTTRNVLWLAGEWVMPLEPLDAADGAALFSARSAAAVPTRSADAGDGSAVAELVRLFDGLPLAIEFGAARLRALTPRELLALMGERFRVLRGQGKWPDRQATLRATFDWSWELLDEHERAALAQWSVFDGGFNAAAAAAVFEPPGGLTGAPWTADLLQSLIDKSWLRRSGAQRYEMLVSTQEYAAERLRYLAAPANSATAVEAAHVRHWSYFGRLTETDVLADGTADLGNLIAACRRATAAGDSAAAAAALTGAWLPLRMAGPLRLALELVQQIDTQAPLTPASIARVDWVAGSASWLIGDVVTAQQRLERGLAAAILAESPYFEVRLRNSLGELLMSTARLPEAQEHVDHALTLARASADPLLEISALNGVAALALERGETAEALEHYERALELTLHAANRRWEGGLRSNLGAVFYGLGRLEEAQAQYEQALKLELGLGNRQWECSARCNLGLLLSELGHAAEACSELETAVRLASDLGNPGLEAAARCNLGIALDSSGDPTAAATQHERAVAMVQELGDQRSEGLFRGYWALALAHLGRHTEAARHLEAGRRLLEEGHDLISLGLSLCNAAECKFLTGNQAGAAQILSEAQRIAGEAGAGAGSELSRTIARVRRL